MKNYKQKNSKEWETAETNTIKIDTLHLMGLTLMKTHVHMSCGNFSGEKHYLFFYIGKKSGIQPFAEFMLLFLNLILVQISSILVG